MFSRFCVFLGITFLLVGGTIDVHAQWLTLEIRGDTGDDRVYNIGDTVTTTFLTKRGGVVAAGEKLTITHYGLTGVTITPSNSTTNAAGYVVVSGTIARAAAYIEAVWTTGDLTALAEFMYSEVAPVIIVVNPPTPKTELKVGDTFTQVITAENRDTGYPTLPLSAWQMDVVYDPLILEVVDVTKGDFLERDGENALFSYGQSPGRIAMEQRHLDGKGVSLAPGDSRVLVALTFRLLLSSETSLGLHNVRLSNPLGERFSYSILLADIEAATPRPRVTDCPLPEPPTPTTLTIVSGYGQEGQPGTRLRSPFIVEVRDQYGDPLSGVNVTFQVRVGKGSGSLSRTTAHLNKPGQYQTYLTLGTSEGAIWVDARATGILQPQTFTATAIRPPEPPKPTTLSIVSGYGQEGIPGKSLAQPFVVEVRDQYGNPLFWRECCFSCH